MAATTFLGVINGLIAVRTGLPSFIVTLATLFIIRGASSVLTSTVTNITYIYRSHNASSRTIPSPACSTGVSPSVAVTSPLFKVSILWWIVIAVVGIYVSAGRDSATDRWWPAACRSPHGNLLGVPVAWVKILLFALTAFSASIPRRSRA